MVFGLNITILIKLVKQRITSSKYATGVIFATDEEIYDNACRIFDNLWNHDDGIRSVCVFISGFSTVRKKQLSIFDNFNNNENMLDNDKLQSVIDEIRDKYGDKVIGYVSDKDNRR